MGHLENPALTADMTAARDFDLGMTGPPLSYSMDFIAGGLVGMLTGLTAAVVLAGFAWWAPIVLGGAWLSTHWLLRESAVWRDRQTDEVRGAQRDADYAYRLAVDPPASKELRLFGLVQWTIDRFVARRTRLHDLQYQATRLRERPLVWSALIVTAANVLVLWALAAAAADGRIDLGQLVIVRAAGGRARPRSRSAASTGRSTAPRRRWPRCGGWSRRWRAAGRAATRARAPPPACRRARCGSAGSRSPILAAPRC